MDKDKKIEILINVYKFWIGTLLIILIALIGGLVTSIRSNLYDNIFFIGFILAYLIFITIVYIIMKLNEALKGL